MKRIQKEDQESEESEEREAAAAAAAAAATSEQRSSNDRATIEQNGEGRGEYQGRRVIRQSGRRRTRGDPPWWQTHASRAAR